MTTFEPMPLLAVFAHFSPTIPIRTHILEAKVVTNTSPEPVAMMAAELQDMIETYADHVQAARVFISELRYAPVVHHGLATFIASRELAYVLQADMPAEGGADGGHQGD